YAAPVMPPVRLPGTPGVNGSVATSGQYQYDTVILERPNANITVTVSTGTHNIRKLYMRETLNITGGSLTMSYNPAYRPNDSTDVLHGGLLSAQFSGPVTLSGGTLNVHTLQVDSTRTFTLGGGTLAFNTINLMPHSTTPAKMLVTNSVNINASGGTIATITNGSGTGSSGLIDLGAGTRSISVGSTTDLLLYVALTNGGLNKAGLGLMRLSKPSGYTLGTTVSSGTLLVNNTTGSGTGTGNITVNSGATLGGTGFISGQVSVSPGATIAPGLVPSIGTLTLGSAQTLSGTAFMAIDRNGGSPVADKIVVSSGTLSYGGTLTVSNAGAAFVGGDVFTLFNAPSYTGAFAATNLPSLTNGMNWWLGNLVTNGSIKVNRKPIGNTDTFTNNPTKVLQIPIASLKSNDTDPDGDSITLTSIAATTTNGVTLTTNSTHIFYSNNVNVADQFSYTINDGHGGTNNGTVSIVQSTNAIFSTFPTVSSNSVTLQIIGYPGTNYYIDRSTNLPVWLTISTNVAPANGVINFTDTFPGLNPRPAASYYRFKW
ncbi:MAG: hypothetical protein JWM68_1693, partial [Verrucomicrobiales bacterium]|nr:hypothetical protein [Verrucomicrobiales bacterium]